MSERVSDGEVVSTYVRGLVEGAEDGTRVSVQYLGR